MIFGISMPQKLSRKRKKALGLPELIAIALGGMVEADIYTKKHKQ